MSMRVMILEDEPPAMAELLFAVEDYDPDIEVVTKLASVRDAARALAGGLAPDLILADTQLADTSSLALFDRVEVSCPVVFVTDDDATLVQAFERGAIDYLRKPIEPEPLAAALDKYLRLRSPYVGRVKEIAEELGQTTAAASGRPTERILTRSGMNLKGLPVERVAWFMSERRLTMVCETGGQRHMVDETLGQLTQMLDPRRFFRLNRSFLAQLDAVKSFRSVGKGRLGVTLAPLPDEDVVVGQERAAQFKSWLEGR